MKTTIGIILVIVIIGLIGWWWQQDQAPADPAGQTKDYLAYVRDIFEDPESGQFLAVIDHWSEAGSAELDGLNTWPLARSAELKLPPEPNQSLESVNQSEFREALFDLEAPWGQTVFTVSVADGEIILIEPFVTP